MFSALSGEQWVGYRVRASTHRILQPGERRHDSRDAGGSAYSTGTVKCYRPSSGEHLVVFDDPMLQPQWVVCQKSSIDVLLGEEGAKPTSEGAAGTGGTGTVATSVFPLTVCKGQSVDYSEQCNCVLCDSALAQGTFRRCTKCGMKCHSYCLSEDATAPGAESSVPSYWPASTALPWTCWNCVGELLSVTYFVPFVVIIVVTHLCVPFSQSASDVRQIPGTRRCLLGTHNGSSQRVPISICWYVGTACTATST